MSKYGKQNKKQRYKCNFCGKISINKLKIDSKILWNEYSKGKQTYSQLSKKYNCSTKTIQRKLDQFNISIPLKKSRSVVVVMDTTYFGKKFGVMLFKDEYTKENLLKYYVKNETIKQYKKGILELQKRGFKILAIVCDGKRGLLKSFNNIPIQMCQFHQVAIIRRYITKNPKLLASIELKKLVSTLKLTDKESFIASLYIWFKRWENFMKQRTTNPVTNKSFYTHKNLRSAYRSLKNNLPWLFTWYDYLELKIPNTTNCIDGSFSDLKNKLRNHNEMSISRKKKFIDGFFEA